MFIGIILSLTVTVALYGSSPSKLLILFIVSMLVLITPICLTTKIGKKKLNALYAYDKFGISFGVFYATFLISISYIFGLPLPTDHSLSTKFILILFTVIMFFLLAHSRNGREIFVVRDYLVIFGLLTLSSRMTVPFSPSFLAVNPAWTAIVIAVLSLPLNIALMIYLGKRNIKDLELPYDVKIAVRDLIYLIIYLIFSILLLYLTSRRLTSVNENFSLKFFIFKFSLAALPGVIIEEVFFRFFIMNMLFKVFKNKIRVNWNLALTLIISSLIFGFYHIKLSTTYLIVSIFGGFIFGLLYIQTRRLSGSIILHSIINALLWN